jgi:hypothetical protein
MDKDDARELAKELSEVTERLPAPLPLARIVKKAARLAAWIGDVRSQAIFEMHLVGFREGEKWADRFPSLDAAELEKALELAQADRRGQHPLSFYGTPIAMMDKEILDYQFDGRLQPGASPAMIENCRLIEFTIVNRVGMFVRDVVGRLGEPVSGGARRSTTQGKKAFIGHGGSSVAWKDLYRFLKDRLHLDCIEFNTECQAGKMTPARLTQMLEESGFAFLVATGEDRHADGTVHARENVIHETGLFQAKLGLERAIVLLEEGCARFSNIDGVTDIRFPKGNIMAVSEEIRRVLEREGFLSRPPS